MINHLPLKITILILSLFSLIYSADTLCSENINYQSLPHIGFKQYIDFSYDIDFKMVTEFSVDKIYYIEGEDMGRFLRGFGIHLGSYIKKLPQSKPAYITYQYLTLTELLMYLSSIPVAIAFTAKWEDESNAGLADPDRPNAFLGICVGILFGTSGIIPHFFKRIPLKRSIRVYNETIRKCYQGP